MHSLPSRRAVARFKLASWVFVFMWLMAFSASGVLFYSLYIEDKRSALFALGLIIGTVLVAVVQWMISTCARCPLCHAPSIARNGCSKHRNARRLFGSYRMRVAFDVIFSRCFRCPYCGESTVIRARERPRSR